MKIFKHVAPEIIFGCGALSQVGESATRLGANKVLVVSDEGLVNAGWLEKTLFYLEEAGLQHEIFCDFTFNPKDNEIALGVKKYLETGCDAILSLGGGSAIDAAKCIATLATNGNKIADYEGINKITKPLPPIVAVPTTAGSGSEVTQFAVVVDTSRKLKMVITSKSLVPDIAIIDPQLLQTLDSWLTAIKGADALSHAIEAFVSLAATPLTDIHALNAIRLISSNLRESVACRTNIEAKMNMAIASLQAGLALSNAICGVGHAMIHQVDGFLNVQHGEANARILPYVMEYNLIACPHKFRQIAEALGENTAGLSTRQAAWRAIKAVRRLFEDIGITRGLAEMGMKEEHIPIFSRNVLNDITVITNPRDVCEKDVAEIFRRAM